MVDENAEEEVTTNGGEKSSRIIAIAVRVGVVVVIPIIVAVLSFKFWISPMLDTSDVKTKGTPVDIIPADTVTMKFPEMKASVMPEEVGGSAPILMYEVSLVCDNLGTMTLITDNMDYFKAMIVNVHNNKTRAELEDQVVQISIRKEMAQESNVLLRRLRSEEEHVVYAAMHTGWTIIEL
jgi:flagellar basal body-associated protein FliL